MEAQSKKNKENIPPPSPPTTNSAPISAPTKIIEAGPTKKMRLTSKLTSDAQCEFESDMCQMFASCGWAWNSSNNPQLCQCFSKWVPEVNVPDRRKLSGPVLDAEVKKVEERVKERVHGQLATGQSDGWKNISKASVVGTMITVDGQVRTQRIYSALTLLLMPRFLRHISFIHITYLQTAKMPILCLPLLRQILTIVKLSLA
jgi:hypothetical protein